jgi:PAS domain S-box-containing protein
MMATRIDYLGRIAIMGNITDITARKRAEEALRLSEANYRLLFSAESDAIIIIDAETTVIVDANGAALALYGYSEKQLVGLSAVKLSAEPEKSIQHIQQVASGEVFVVSPGVAERLHKKKDGTIFPVEISSGVYTLGDRKMICAVIRDVSERKRAEEKLRESQRLLQRTLNSLLDAVLIIDAETVKIMDCNPAASAMFGYSREEMLGETTHFLHVNEAALHQFRGHLYAALQEKGFLFLSDFVMKRKDGTTFPTEHSVMPIENEEGKRVAWVSVVRDVSERKQAEEELHKKTEDLQAQARILEESNTALRVLVKQREQDRGQLEQRVQSNLKQLVLPHVETLMNTRLDTNQKAYLNIIRSNLHNIVSPFLGKLSPRYKGLTAREIQVADFVKHGLTTKEIAGLLNISPGAVEYHRMNLRQKLGLKKKSVNLRSHLLSLE